MVLFRLEQDADLLHPFALFRTHQGRILAALMRQVYSCHLWTAVGKRRPSQMPILSCLYGCAGRNSRGTVGRLMVGKRALERPRCGPLPEPRTANITIWLTVERVAFSVHSAGSDHCTQRRRHNAQRRRLIDEMPAAYALACDCGPRTCLFAASGADLDGRRRGWLRLVESSRSGVESAHGWRVRKEPPQLTLG